MTGMF